MEYGAIYLHKKESQVRIMTEGGEVIDRRIATTRDRLTTLFWGRPHARILIEASTESEWVAQHLETLGHEVEVLTAPRAPWQNPFVERFIGSARRECFDHVIVFNEAGVRKLMTFYCSYHEQSRTHLSF